MLHLVVTLLTIPVSVHLLNSIDSDKFVSIDCVLFLTSREHFLHSFEGKLLLLFHDSPTILVSVLLASHRTSLLALLEVARYSGQEVSGRTVGLFFGSLLFVAVRVLRVY